MHMQAGCTSHFLYPNTRDWVSPQSHIALCLWHYNALPVHLLWHDYITTSKMYLELC